MPYAGGSAYGGQVGSQYGRPLQPAGQMAGTPQAGLQSLQGGMLGQGTPLGQASPLGQSGYGQQPGRMGETLMRQQAPSLSSVSAPTRAEAFAPQSGATSASAAQSTTTGLSSVSQQQTTVSSATTSAVSGARPLTSAGMNQGTNQGMSQGMNQGMSQGLNQGMGQSQGLNQGVGQRLTADMSQGLNQGVSQSQGLNSGVSTGLRPAVTAQGPTPREQALEQRVRELEQLVIQKDEQIKDLQSRVDTRSARDGKHPMSAVSKKVRSPVRTGSGFRKVMDSKPAQAYSAVDHDDPIDVRLEEFYNSTGSQIMFRRINRGFYRFGDTIVELEIINHKLMARTEDGWNRGNAGPIEKFLMNYENIEREKAGIPLEA